MLYYVFVYYILYDIILYWYYIYQTGAKVIGEVEAFLSDDGQRSLRYCVWWCDIILYCIYWIFLIQLFTFSLVIENEYDLNIFLCYVNCYELLITFHSCVYTAHICFIYLNLYTIYFIYTHTQNKSRYAPFYGNSGFYYLLSSPRTKHFAWSIMTAFDSVQVLNIFIFCIFQ